MLLSLFYTAIILVVVGYVFSVKWREKATTGAARLGFVAAVLLGCAVGASDTSDGGSTALAIALAALGGIFALLAAYASFRARSVS
jgi:hypothetical protein